MQRELSRRIELLLRYIAGMIFVGIMLMAIETSFRISAMEDLGFAMYHDPVDVHVFWLQSQACMAIPPDNYIANCTALPTLGATLMLTVLLIIVIFAHSVVHKQRSRIAGQTNQRQSYQPARQINMGEEQQLC